MKRLQMWERGLSVQHFQDPVYFGPDQPLEKRYHRLPHWQQNEVVYYVT